MIDVFNCVAVFLLDVFSTAAHDACIICSPVGY